MLTEENLGKIPQDLELIEKVGDGVPERNLASDNEEIEDVENDSEKLKDDQVLTSSGIPTSLVNPLSGNAAQILPLLQNLLVHNEIQRERLMGLIQLYDPNGGKLSLLKQESNCEYRRRADSNGDRYFDRGSVFGAEKLEEELENQKKANAQLEDEIKRLTMSRDPEQDD